MQPQPMNCLQFIAAMTQALVWPALIGVLLYVFRKRLIAFFNPQDESANWKAEFMENLKKAEGQSKELVSADEHLPAAPRLENEFPETVVALVYAGLLKRLAEARSRLKLAKDTPPREVIRQLVSKTPKPKDTSALFESLTAARKAALLTGEKDPVTHDEAIKFQTQVQRLRLVLDKAIDNIPAEPAQSH
jgi:hypothetical protein